MVHSIHRVGRWLPEIAVVVWCAFIGIAVWQHAQRSEQPPIHDAQTYFQKAQNFWNAVSNRKPVNPFNLEPTFRPPGTVLMSYPFGFDIDFRGFYFRSVYWPVILLALAAYVAVWYRRMDGRSRTNAALAAIFLTTLPSIYQFELTADHLMASHFGLVDNFLMGLAALAAAASLRSLQTCSLAWVALAAGIASLCLFVKPSGAYVMALVGLNWLLPALAHLRRPLGSPSRAAVRESWAWVVKGLCLFAAFYFPTLGISLSSQYLSPQNLAFGSGAVAIMQSEWTLVPGALQVLIRNSIGYSLPAVALIIATLALLNRRPLPDGAAPRREASRHGLLLAALLTLAFGIWFWALGSGGLYAARYFMPFAAMAAIYALPLALEAVGRAPLWQAAAVRTLCVLTALNLALLLAQSDPPHAWQKWSGVNLASGAPNPVMDQARQFVVQTSSSSSRATLYALPLGLTDSTFQAFADYHRAVNPGAPSITIRRPIDWIRTSTYRLTEILSADYILLEPVNDPQVRASIAARSSIDSLEEERMVMQAWATKLSAEDGVSLVSASSSARLLRIDDAVRLEASLSRLQARHQWRTAFLEANPRRWWSERDMARELAVGPASLSDVQFGEHVRVRALSVNSTDVEIAVKLWWELIEPGAGGDWFFFVHALDGDGGIMLNNQISLAYGMPLRGDESIRFDALTFRRPPFGRVAAIGVGVFRAGDGHILTANRGNRDWNDTRVVLPIR